MCKHDQLQGTVSITLKLCHLELNIDLTKVGVENRKHGRFFEEFTCYELALWNLRSHLSSHMGLIILSCPVVPQATMLSLAGLMNVHWILLNALQQSNNQNEDTVKASSNTL